MMIVRTGLQVLGRVAPPRLSILIFHRVHASRDSLFPHEPDADRFEQLMRFVAGAFRVIPLGEAASHLRRGTLPPRALSISFDDGYADNAEVALPILQRCGLPACFFVATGFLDGGRMWNDSVIECLRACRRPIVDLGAFGLGRCALATPLQKRLTIGALLSRIRYLSLAERADAVSRLQSMCGVRNLPTTLMMRSAQVRALHDAGMEIGAHTVNHPILTTLTAARAAQEIDEGRQQLEAIVGAPVTLFAYPNGKPGQDYDRSHVALLDRLGFTAAVSTAPGVARIGDDPYQLPRFTPWAKSLTGWATRLILNQRNTDFATV